MLAERDELVRTRVANGQTNAHIGLPVALVDTVKTTRRLRSQTFGF